MPCSGRHWGTTCENRHRWSLHWLCGKSGTGIPRQMVAWIISFLQAIFPFCLFMYYPQKEAVTLPFTPGKWHKAKWPVTREEKQSSLQLWRYRETWAALPVLPTLLGSIACLSCFAMLRFSLLHKWLQSCKSVISGTWTCKWLVKKSLCFHGQRTFTQLIS